MGGGVRGEFLLVSFSSLNTGHAVNRKFGNLCYLLIQGIHGEEVIGQYSHSAHNYQVLTEEQIVITIMITMNLDDTFWFVSKPDLSHVAVKV